MKLYRHERGFSVADMAKKADIGERLLEAVESGSVTHAMIAQRIGKVYELPDADIRELIPENQREGNPTYDPDKYRLPERICGRKFTIAPNLTSEADRYTHEQAERIRKKGYRKG